MSGNGCFPYGALLINDDGEIVALRGSEMVVHFVVPMPTPVDVPDGWDIWSSTPLTVEEMTSLSPGCPQRRLGCYLQFFHQDLPSSDTEFDTSMAVLQARVLGHAKDETGEEESRPRGTDHWTFAHLMMETPPDPDREVLAARLDDGLEYLREVQIGLWVTTGRHSPPVGIETIPVVIPLLVRRVDAERSEWGNGVGLMLIPAPWKLSRADPPQPRGHPGEVGLAMYQAAKSPESFLHRRFELAAKNQMSYGDYHAAVLSAATSCESLFDFLLSALLWEEGRQPDDVAGLFTRSLDRRLTTEFPPRLGGDWNPHGSGIIAEWSTKIRRVRNAAIHRGVEPTRSQAADALTTLQDLSHAVGDLLRQPATCDRYPRSARMYSPEATGARLAALLDDAREPEWVTTLSRWIREREVAVKASRGWPIADPDSEVRVVGLVSPAGTRWAVWRPDDRVAVVVPRPADLSAAQYEGFNKLRANLSEGSYCCVTMAHASPVRTPPVALQPKGAWMLQHHLIPEQGVMVDPDLDLLHLRQPAP
jgi:hypothetical protein